jgi:hypothetical protein
MKSHIVCSATFFENRAIYEIMCKNNVEMDRPTDDNTAWHMRTVLCIPKARHKHSEYVILIDFPVQ